MLAAEGHLSRLRASGYDLLALQPASEASAVRAAQSGWADIIVAAPLPSEAPSLHGARVAAAGGATGGGKGKAAAGASQSSSSSAAGSRPIRWHKPQLEAILEAGVPLELRYGPAIADAAARRALLGDLARLQPLVRGRGACVLLSSGTADPFLVRAPSDVGSLLSAMPGTGFGSLERALCSLWLAPVAALRSAEMRRFAEGRGVLDVSGGDQTGSSGGAQGSAKARVVGRGGAGTLAEQAARESGAHFEAAALAGAAGGGGGGGGSKQKRAEKKLGAASAPTVSALTPVGATVLAAGLAGTTAGAAAAAGAVSLSHIGRALQELQLGPGSAIASSWVQEASSRASSGALVGAGSGEAGASGMEAEAGAAGLSERLSDAAGAGEGGMGEMTRSQRRRLRRRRQREAREAAGTGAAAARSGVLRPAVAPELVVEGAGREPKASSSSGSAPASAASAPMESESAEGAAGASALGLGARLRAMIDQGKAQGVVKGRSGAVDASEEASARGDSAAAAMQEETGLKFVDF